MDVVDALHLTRRWCFAPLDGKYLGIYGYIHMYFVLRTTGFWLPFYSPRIVIGRPTRLNDERNFSFRPDRQER